MIKFNKLISLLILCIFVEYNNGISAAEHKGDENNDGLNNDSALNNIDGYLEQRKLIMDKYYARLNKLHESGRFTRQPQAVTQVVSTTPAQDTQQIATGTQQIIGECKNNSTSFIRFYLNVYGGTLSSSNSFEYSGNGGVCIECITLDSADKVSVHHKSGGPGSDHAHFEFGAPSNINMTVVTINVKGRFGKC